MIWDGFFHRGSGLSASRDEAKWIFDTWGSEGGWEHAPGWDVDFLYYVVFLNFDDEFILRCFFD